MFHVMIINKYMYVKALNSVTPWNWKITNIQYNIYFYWMSYWIKLITYKNVIIDVINIFSILLQCSSDISVLCFIFYSYSISCG